MKKEKEINFSSPNFNSCQNIELMFAVHPIIKGITIPLKIDGQDTHGYIREIKRLEHQDCVKAKVEVETESETGEKLIVWIKIYSSCRMYFVEEKE